MREEIDLTSVGETQPSSPHLAIKLNIAGEPVPCALCGTTTEPLIGPDLFLADTWELVCWKCGQQHALELVIMLGSYWQRQVADVEQFRPTPSA